LLKKNLYFFTSSFYFSLAVEEENNADTVDTVTILTAAYDMK
jgi:hypothetical protein